MRQGPAIAGKYRLLRPLGKGSMGEVWAAAHESLGREVAIKLIYEGSPELAARLKREALACGRLEHPNIVRVYDFGETEGGDPFLVMELLVGETLADRIARERRVPPAEAVAVALDVARALGAAHEAGIVHRDLKPANVFLAQGGEARVKVLDFGVSKILTSFDMSVTTDGALVGSPAYMSPEQARALPEIDPRADLWAIGVLLFEMLTGTRPFAASTVVGVVTEILAGPIPTLAEALPGVDPRLDAAVRRCLTRDVEQRMASAATLVDMLTPVLASLRAASGPRSRVVVEEMPTVVEEPSADDPASTMPKAPRAPVDDSAQTIARPAAPTDEDDERETAVMGGRDILAFRMANRAHVQKGPPNVPAPAPARPVAIGAGSRLATTPTSRTASGAALRLGSAPAAPAASRSAAGAANAIVSPPATTAPIPSSIVSPPGSAAQSAGPIVSLPASAVASLPVHEDGPTHVLSSRAAEARAAEEEENDPTAATRVLPLSFGHAAPPPSGPTPWDTAPTLLRTPMMQHVPGPPPHSAMEAGSETDRDTLTGLDPARRNNAQTLWMTAIAGLVLGLVVFAGLSLLR
ncbi:MAG: protein kinase [Minicystis sp.]